MNEEYNQQPPPKKPHTALAFIGATLAFCIIAVVFTFSIWGITNCLKNNKTPPLTRAATNNDIYVEQSSLTSYRIKPNEDIDNLELEFKFYDSKHALVETQTKEVGNVTKGNEFTVTVQVENFNAIFSSYYQVNVINGYVSKLK